MLGSSGIVPSGLCLTEEVLIGIPQGLEVIHNTRGNGGPTL